MSIVSNLLGKIVKFNKKSYEIVEANTKQVDCISLRNTTNGLFIRHMDGNVTETNDSVNSMFFASDSSFTVEERGDGIILRCTNEDMTDHYICKLDEETFIVDPDLVEYIFIPENKSKEAPKINPSKHVPGAVLPQIVGHFVQLLGKDYLIVPANNHNIEHVSLLNPIEASYLRHFDGQVIESDPDKNAEFFPLDSSFFPNFDKGKVAFKCVNENMQNQAIVLSENETILIGNADQAAYFTLSGSGNVYELLKIILAELHKIRTQFGQ